MSKRNHRLYQMRNFSGSARAIPKNTLAQKIRLLPYKMSNCGLAE